MGEAGVVEEALEGGGADGALADVLVAVEAGGEGGLGVVAVPDADGGEADGCADELHGLDVAVVGDDVVAGDVDVAGVEADGDGGAGLEGFDEFGDLFKLAAERELGSGGIFDEDAEGGGGFCGGFGKCDGVDGALDGFGGEAEAFLAGEALPTAGVKDEVFCAEGEGALDLAAEGDDGVGADGFGLAAEVDEVAGVDGDGGDVELGAEVAHLGGVGGGDGGGTPLAGAGGEDLEGVGASLDGAVDGGPDASGGADVDADAAGVRLGCHGFELSAAGLCAPGGLAMYHRGTEPMPLPRTVNGPHARISIERKRPTMPERQNYKNHTRFDPIWHFFIGPLLLLNILFAIAYTIRHWPFHSHLFLWGILMSVVLLMAVGKARQHSTKVQDRVIRLEERLRLKALLGADEYARAEALTVDQLIGLRFASDAELPGLVKKTLDQNWTRKQIKEAIENWRPDYLRV